MREEEGRKGEVFRKQRKSTFENIEHYQFSDNSHVITGWL